MPDIGNLLALSAVSANLHKARGLIVDKTEIYARSATKKQRKIKGINTGFYEQFLEVKKRFFIKSLVLKDLSCHLNMGAQFNMVT